MRKLFIVTAMLLVLCATAEAAQMKAKCTRDGKYSLTLTSTEISLCRKGECDVQTISSARDQKNAGSGADEVVLTADDGMDTIMAPQSQKNFILFWKANDWENLDDRGYLCKVKS